MSHPNRKPREFPEYTPTDLARAADALRAAADRMTGPNVRRIQQTIRDAATIGYPHRTSGTHGQPHHEVDEDGDPVQPDTATEAAALNPDRAAAQALADIATLTTIAALAGPADLALQTYDPTRAVAVCKTCGEPLPANTTQCERLDADGRRCGTRRGSQVALCANPNHREPLEPGKSRKGRCLTCARFLDRNGRDRVPKNALDLGPDVIVDDSGVAHA